jgi:ABC-type transport system substrate-binding protein
MKRSLTLRALTLALVAVVAVGAGMAEAQTPKKGGVLRIGNLGEPPSLDPHWGTQTITEVMANHLYESLYALDEGYQPFPMLAESHTVSKDGLVYTL